MWGGWLLYLLSGFAFPGWESLMDVPTLCQLHSQADTLGTACTARLLEMVPGDGNQRPSGKIPSPRSQSSFFTHLQQVLQMLLDLNYKLCQAKVHEWWQQRSRTYCALGCLQRQQGNLPQRNKTWQNVFRSYIHYKAVNIYACCVLSGGQAAWLGTGREIAQ